MKKILRNSHETIAGFFVLSGLLILVYMTVKLGDVSLFGHDSITLTARFTTVSGLKTANPVEMHGIEVGKVEKLVIDQKLQMAVATLNINNGIEVYSDAIASIKTAGLIGDKFISLDPGGSGSLLKSGDVIINTESPADLGELIGKYAFGSVDSKESGSSDKADDYRGREAERETEADDIDFNLNLDE